MSLEEFLISEADKLAPLDADYPDYRSYQENVNPDALDRDAWLDNNTSYIWKVGVLSQIDSNKCDYVRLFIGHERAPGRFDFIGMLHWAGGENDDIGRSLGRYLKAAGAVHPVFEELPHD